MMRKRWLAAVALAIAIGLSGCSATSSSAPRTVAAPAARPGATAAPVPAVSPYVGVAYPPLPSGWQDGRAALTATVGDGQYVEATIELDSGMR